MTMLPREEHERRMVLYRDGLNDREIADQVHVTTEAMKVALTALRPVSREQVEKVFPGCEKCRNQANWPSWIEKGFVYCPKCGTPLTSWAWEKQVERLEALKDGL